MEFIAFVPVIHAKLWPTGLASFLVPKVSPIAWLGQPDSEVISCACEDAFGDFFGFLMTSE
jgi:hypothetical protein